jgi:hypothetical protein
MSFHYIPRITFFLKESIFERLRAPGNSNNSPAVQSISSYCFVKMREKSSLGTRRWVRKWAVSLGDAVIFYKDSSEDKINNQEMPIAVYMRQKQAIVLGASKHNYTFGLQDTTLQQIVIWLRYDNEEDYMK